MHVIYALIDPRDNAIKYVGITEDVYARFQQHIRCDGSSFAKNAWVMELRAANKMVIMETLEEVGTRELALEREAYWIKHFEMLSEPIVNVSKRSSPRRAKRTNLRVGRKMEIVGQEAVQPLPVEMLPTKCPKSIGLEQVKLEDEKEESEIAAIVLGKDCSLTLDVYAVALQLRKCKKILGYRGLMEPFGLSEYYAKVLNKRILQDLKVERAAQ